MFCKVLGEVLYEVLGELLGEVLGKVLGELSCKVVGEVSEGGTAVPPNKTFYIQAHEV